MVYGSLRQLRLSTRPPKIDATAETLHCSIHDDPSTVKPRNNGFEGTKHIYPLLPKIVTANI